MEMLRIIQATDQIQATVVLAEEGPLTDALADAGARVELLPLSERTRGLKRTEIHAGRKQALAALDVADYVRRLRHRLVELRPHVVSAISLKAGIYGTLAARLARLPVVFHLHDQITADYIAPQAVRPTRLLVGTLPSAVIAPSRTILDLVGWFRPGMRAEVIPHPIPMPADPVPRRPHVERVGIVGRLAPWKGQDVFLRAFARAFPRSSTRAVVIGNAMFGEEDYAGELRALAGELGIADRVDFLGFRRDIEAELEHLDLLVHASVLIEPLGTAVFEGMAAGLPVIAAATGGPAEYITHGTDGLLHNPGDVQDLAAMMSLAADDRDLRARLAAAGRERVRDFAPEAVVQAWLEVYDGVVRGNRAQALSTFA